jgi:transposase-like protein
MKAVTIPYNARNEAFCPFCNSLHTRYHHAERRGHCEDCGRDWTMTPPRRPSTYPMNGGPIT